MSQEVELPPLPLLTVNLDKHAAEELAATARCHDAFVCGYGVEGDLHLWTEDQMREYARAAVLQERERCGRLVDGYANANTSLQVLLEPAMYGANKTEKARVRALFVQLAAAIRQSSTSV